MQLKTDVELLKRDVSNIQVVLGRIDDAIVKIADVSNGINQVLAAHGKQFEAMNDSAKERQVRLEKDVEIIHNRITKHEEGFDEQFKEYHKELSALCQAMDTRISTLEKWKWYIMGTAWGFGFIIATFLQGWEIFK